MSIAKFPTPTSPETAPRKPVMAIMGEFSAGKSTLTNLLIGSDPLPVKVTATQLPPVKISYGEEPPFREDLQGDIHPVDLDNLTEIPFEETSLIHIFLKSDILELCDLIDMPGISDPNMDSEVWERVIEQADGVLWCTHATQAWRQSEAAVWKSLSPDLFGNSFLLLTRFDKLLTEKDRDRVVKRVQRETDGLFAGLFPISLTNAIAAKDDRGLWELSGAEEFAHDLVDMLSDMSASLGRPNSIASTPPEAPEISPEASNVLRLDNALNAASLTTPKLVMPSRVKLDSSARSGLSRPARQTSATARPNTLPEEIDPAQAPLPHQQESS
ncbi:MAG: dynamin family protein [Paracoccaceae bacterium]